MRFPGFNFPNADRAIVFTFFSIHSKLIVYTEQRVIFLRTDFCTVDKTIIRNTTFNS